ncbi:MAG: hypothetical protein R3314_10365 [Longimicrobiales bacterium]|nr:hypothetical protein [Longimicrobiales bacterium]
MGNKKRVVLVLTLVAVYVTADIMMDIFLFPRLPEPLREHHREIVESHVVVFGLTPLWIIGLIFSESRGYGLAVAVFGSALAATVVFAFTSLPFIWAASAFPSLATPFLFLHDHGLYVYFFGAISIFGHRYIQSRQRDFG